MTIRRASVMGQCMGVKRGLDLALEAAGTEGLIYSLGPLIHNPRAVAELRERGVQPLTEAELDQRVAGRTVVIRAHGVPPRLRARIIELGARVLDATCPRVIASQKRAAAYARKGFTVLIAGDRDHGEVAGIAGYAAEAAAEEAAEAAASLAAGPAAETPHSRAGTVKAWAVVGSPEEAEALALSGPVAVIAQTTIRAQEYRAICAVLSRRFGVVEVVDSICPATGERQEALAELAQSCDAILVVGGRNSANTQRLLAAATERGRPAWLVETAGELPGAVFAYERVGLTAGASTPDSLIDEVEEALLRGRAGRGT